MKNPFIPDESTPQGRKVVENIKKVFPGLEGDKCKMVVASVFEGATLAELMHGAIPELISETMRKSITDHSVVLFEDIQELVERCVLPSVFVILDDLIEVMFDEERFFGKGELAKKMFMEIYSLTKLVETVREQTEKKKEDK